MVTRGLVLIAVLNVKEEILCSFWKCYHIIAALTEKEITFAVVKGK